MFRLPIFILAVSIWALSSACNSVSSNNANRSADRDTTGPNANANSVRSDVEELGLRVNLPFETEELVWREYTTERKIVAVMRFTSEDSARIVADAEKNRPVTRVDVTSEVWFPQELIAQADMTGDDRLAGNSYGAASFLMPPYSEGALVRVDNTDYFILQVLAK